MALIEFENGVVGTLEITTAASLKIMRPAFQLLAQKVLRR